AQCTVPSTCALRCGIAAWKVRPVRTSSPPITSGISTCAEAISASLACSEARSGVPGAWGRTGSLTAGGGRKTPGALISICRGEACLAGRMSSIIMWPGVRLAEGERHHHRRQRGQQQEGCALAGVVGYGAADWCDEVV